tara:strand:- start:3428 stop:3937 length:510 start_codon:yes stop_codon:yes gene_type:complete
MYRTGALIVAVLLHCTVLIPAAWAEAGEPRIGELSALDRQYMAQQRDLIEDITLRRLGRDFSGDRERDLALLQDMLDKRLVDASQTRELQAMGMILGEHLADALDMHWVIYEDALGRSRALQYADTDNYLFPMTMISRRVEAGSSTSVKDIYQKAYDIIDAARPALPFR